MKHPIHEFVFQCPNCKQTANIKEQYEPNNIYKCPSCHTTTVIPEYCVKYTIKNHPLTFICPHCNRIQHTYDFKYKHDVDGFNITECNCPECAQHIIWKEETILHAIQKQKETYSKTTK